MKMKGPVRKKRLNEIIKKRISNLIFISSKIYELNPQLSKLYIKLAFSLVKRYKVSLGDLKWKFCRKCFLPWIEHSTVSISKEDKFDVYRCLGCSYVRRKYLP